MVYNIDIGATVGTTKCRHDELYDILSLKVCNRTNGLCFPLSNCKYFLLLFQKVVAHFWAELGNLLI